MIISVALPTVMFNESMYSVDENGGPVRVVVVISEPPVSDTIIEVYNMNGTATGEYCSISINY